MRFLSINDMKRTVPIFPRHQSSSHAAGQKTDTATFTGGFRSVPFRHLTTKPPSLSTHLPPSLLPNPLSLSLVRFTASLLDPDWLREFGGVDLEAVALPEWLDRLLVFFGDAGSIRSSPHHVWGFREGKRVWLCPQGTVFRSWCSGALSCPASSCVEY